MDCRVRVALACQAALVQSRLIVWKHILMCTNVLIKINAGRGDGGVGPG